MATELKRKLVTEHEAAQAAIDALRDVASLLKALGNDALLADGIKAQRDAAEERADRLGEELGEYNAAKAAVVTCVDLLRDLDRGIRTMDEALVEIREIERVFGE